MGYDIVEFCLMGSLYIYSWCQSAEVCILRNVDGVGLPVVIIVHAHAGALLPAYSAVSKV